MKGTKKFKATIKKYLDAFAESDPEFKIKYLNKDKKLDDCITYILNTVKSKNVHGFMDSEIYGMAVHYYDESKIDIGKAIDMVVKVNHHVEFTDEEKDELIKQAREKVINEEMAKMRKKPVKKTPIVKPKEEIPNWMLEAQNQFNK